MNPKQMMEEQTRLQKLHYRQCWKVNVDPLEISDDVEPYMPWFLKCNPDRFAYWFNKPDKRYNKMTKILKDLKGGFELPHNEFLPKTLFNRYYISMDKNVKDGCNVTEVRMED